MPGKVLSLERYLSKSLTDKKPKRVKGIIGNLFEPKDFLTVLTMLDGQDKTISETIDFYEALFERFGFRSQFIDGYMIKKEWHNWTIVLLHLSNILWKSREKFEPKPWLETNKRIYEITFKILKSFDSEKRDHRECKHCSDLFSVILFNFTSYGRGGDIDELRLPSVDKLKEICEKNVGLNWYYLTCGRIFEEKINSNA